MPDIRRARLGGERRHDERGHGQDEQRRDHASRARLEALRAVLETTEEEGKAQDEQAVREDRPDERGLDHDHEPGLQREQADEQFGEIAQRGLQDAGCARAQAMAKLIGALGDHRRQRRERDPGHDEDDDVIEADAARNDRRKRRDHGDGNGDRGVAAEDPGQGNQRLRPRAHLARAECGRCGRGPHSAPARRPRSPTRGRVRRPAGERVRDI